MATAATATPTSIPGAVGYLRLPQESLQNEKRRVIWAEPCGMPMGKIWTEGKNPPRHRNSGLWGLTEAKGQKCLKKAEEFNNRKAC